MQPSLTGSEVGIHYLSLALFARRVIDGLIVLIEGELGQVEFLDEAISSLRELDVQAGYPASNAVQHYEQVQIVQGIGSREDRGKIVALLEELRVQDVAGPQLEGSAHTAIDFFYKLEKQALINLQRPPQESLPSPV